MTKAELIASLTKAYPHLVPKEVDLIVTVIFNQIGAALARGDRVELRRFGAFTVRSRKARMALNPKTRENVPVDRHLVPFFKAGKELHGRVDPGPVLMARDREGSTCEVDAAEKLR